MKISVIIPAHNEEEYVGKCISSVLRNNPNNILEILVVDNASSDHTKEIASEFPGVKVVREDKKGISYARQKGFEESKGDILCYIDADSHVPEDFFGKVLDLFSSYPKASIISGPFFYDDLGLVKRVLVYLYWYALALPVYWLIGYMATGTNLNIRRKSLEQIGGFDVRLNFYGEDTNIARMLKKAGQVKFVPSLTVHTSNRRLAKEGIFSMAFVYVLNFLSIVFFKKPYTTQAKDIR